MAKIPVSPEEIFDEFTHDLQSVYNSDLTAIILYGSGAKGEYVAKKSDINFLVVLSQNGIEDLDKALELISKWRKRNVAVPLFLTENYIDTVLDTFPIEFLDLKKFHQVVYGADVLENLEINKDDLRRQIERELRGKLLHLREGFLNTGHDREQLKGMLAASVTTIASILEGLLHFKGIEIPKSRAQIFAETAKAFDLDHSVFVQLGNIRNGEWHGSRVQLVEVTKSYISQIKKLVEVVDKI